MEGIANVSWFFNWKKVGILGVLERSVGSGYAALRLLAGGVLHPV